ncbi:uncharacterized protein RMCFA_6324 [Mycolicibacterium fortuitum subsp. acetamidolyticum]|uniref:Alanine and proline rich membrane protein n=1 Tax=Mycolicibacterium fortuitum subsp. acetamidolyticum TaxID=144550 RepID=A0A100WXB8_MYCFO|nr:hypothetical protein [Mycolicibacterium fortuitum]GAT06213.1 uncharacterized protein RMCFA_6324 [Mycolicibacterium fortuitum subsp. acetamidolyticum]
MTDPAPPPTYPAWPPQAPYPPAPRPRRRWAATATAAVISAAVAATLASIITANNTGRDSAATATASTVTVTAQPPTPNSPTPVPAATADRTTCQAWVSAGTLIRGASEAQSVIPPGMTIVDPAVQDNPAWKAGVIKAGDLYGQAADTLAAGTPNGTTPMLDQTAAAAVGALQALSTTTKGFDEASGNGYAVVKSVANALDVLCERLAPR